jgi:membrane-bound lytic murein transglycosylase B
VVALTVAAVSVAALIPAGAAAAATSRTAPSGLAAIPAAYLTWYADAARTCRGLAWEVLAAIGTMESDNGRSAARGVHHGKNRKGAEGPMQFEPATFAEYGVRADRSRKLSPYDPEDAIFSAARMLCSDGGGRARGLKGAVFAYNHARRYVRDVLALAARYTAAAARRDRPRPARHRASHPRRPAHR